MQRFTYEGDIKVEGRKSWMDDVTQSKFDEWDAIIISKILTKGTTEQRNRALALLRDPTIWAYAFLKDDDGRPFKLYSYQDLIINDPSDRVMFVAANQVGKSIALCIKALHYALTHPGHNVIMVSKTLPQSQDLLRTIRRRAKMSDLSIEEDIGDSENTTMFSIRHHDLIEGRAMEQPQSRIICVPATEGALGYPAHLLLLDELAFYEDGEYLYEQVFQPRTYHTKGQIVVFSNPNGQQGVFWKQWNSSRFHKYRFTYLDCPSNNQDGFDALATEMEQERIDSTLLAIFTSPEGGFFSLEERQRMQERRPNRLPMEVAAPMAIFFDFAKQHDHTVRGAAHLVDGGKGMFVHELKIYPLGTGYDVVVDDLEQIIRYYGNRIYLVGWDNTGVGAGIEDFIKRIRLMGIACVPVDFSLPNKSRMYTILQVLSERNLQVDNEGNSRIGIRIPFTPEGDKQLSRLRFKRTSRGMLQVHHEDEKDLDDIPDVLAGLCGLLIHKDFVPSSAAIVRSKDFPSCLQCGEVIEGEEEEGLERCTKCGALQADLLGVV